MTHSPEQLRKKVEARTVSAHDKNYNTILSQSEESGFQNWKSKNAPNDSGQDYDLRGAYKAGMQRDSDSGHMSDRFKKPNHPTFSVESVYAKEAPEKAGHWNGNTYIKAKRK
jgi:hypothetical protein